MKVALVGLLLKISSTTHAFELGKYSSFPTNCSEIKHDWIVLFLFLIVSPWRLDYQNIFYLIFKKSSVLKIITTCSMWTRI
jgi:hypothetical protein